MAGNVIHVVAERQEPIGGEGNVVFVGKGVDESSSSGCQSRGQRVET
jgi:hypothetical protein